MKMKRLGMTSLLACLLCSAAQDASAFYNSQTGRWLSRDPITEKGGANLHGFVKNNPISTCDNLGLLDYHIENIDPTGIWQVMLSDETVSGETFKGFRSRYILSRNPPCPCKKENIILVQAIRDAKGTPPIFDIVGTVPPHDSSTPVPGYYDSWSKPPADLLTIIDAPYIRTSPNMPGTWKFEDCAVCRTRPNAKSVDDKVLGCVKFTFQRIDQTTAEIAVESAGNTLTGRKAYIVNAESPGRLWKKALQWWQSP
jgi:hypothetical protein